MAVTQEMIAKQASVSQTTVSQILNRVAKVRVDRETREKVLRIAKQMDYHPNIIARGLVSRKTHNIGIALFSPDYLTDPYFSTIISGILHQVGLHDYSMQVTVTQAGGGESSQNLFFMKKLKEGCLDGLVILDQMMPDKEILWLRKRKTPFVLVDRFVPRENVNCVRVDNREGILRATEHLIGLGHKRIAFLSEPAAWNKSAEMVASFRMTVEKHGLSVDENLIVNLENVEQTRNVIYGWCDFSMLPSAIVCADDKYAAASIMALRDRSVDVPKDVAVVGYNDKRSQFWHMRPQLTSVQVPLQELGEQSAKMLFELIAGRDVGNAEILLKPALVVRESCGASTRAPPQCGDKFAKNDG